MKTRLTITAISALVLFSGYGCGNSGSDPVSPVDGPQTQSTGATNQPVVTSPGGQSPVAQPAFGSIENLFGRVSFEYKLNGSTNTFLEAAIFTADGEGDPILGGRSVFYIVPGREIGIGCVEMSVDVDFLCTKVNIDRITDVFAFTMTSQFAGSGNYESCSSSTCGSDARDSPDGTVAVSISRSIVVARSGLRMNGLSLTDAEADDYKAADILEFGSALTAVDNRDNSLLIRAIADQTARVIKHR